MQTTTPLSNSISGPTRSASLALEDKTIESSIDEDASAQVRTQPSEGVLSGLTRRTSHFGDLSNETIQQIAEHLPADALAAFSSLNIRLKDASSHSLKAVLATTQMRTANDIGLFTGALDRTDKVLAGLRAPVLRVAHIAIAQLPMHERTAAWDLLFNRLEKQRQHSPVSITSLARAIAGLPADARCDRTAALINTLGRSPTLGTDLVHYKMNQVMAQLPVTSMNEDYAGLCECIARLDPSLQHSYALALPRTPARLEGNGANQHAIFNRILRSIESSPDQVARLLINGLSKALPDVSPDFRATAMADLLLAMKPLHAYFKSWMLHRMVATIPFQPDTFATLLPACVKEEDQALTEKLAVTAMDSPHDHDHVVAFEQIRQQMIRSDDPRLHADLTLLLCKLIPNIPFELRYEAFISLAQECARLPADESTAARTELARTAGRLHPAQLHALLQAQYQKLEKLSGEQRARVLAVIGESLRALETESVEVQGFLDQLDTLTPEHQRFVFESLFHKFARRLGNCKGEEFKLLLTVFAKIPDPVRRRAMIQFFEVAGNLPPAEQPQALQSLYELCAPLTAHETHLLNVLEIDVSRLKSLPEKPLEPQPQA